MSHGDEGARAGDPPRPEREGEAGEEQQAEDYSGLRLETEERECADNAPGRARQAESFQDLAVDRLAQSPASHRGGHGMRDRHRENRVSNGVPRCERRREEAADSETRE